MRRKAGSQIRKEHAMRVMMAAGFIAASICSSSLFVQMPKWTTVFHRSAEAPILGANRRHHCPTSDRCPKRRCRKDSPHFTERLDVGREGFAAQDWPRGSGQWFDLSDVPPDYPHSADGTAICSSFEIRDHAETGPAHSGVRTRQDAGRERCSYEQCRAMRNKINAQINAIRDQIAFDPQQ